jgi:hypothetical protein
MQCKIRICGESETEMVTRNFEMWIHTVYVNYDGRYDFQFLLSTLPIETLRVWEGKSW